MWNRSFCCAACAGFFASVDRDSIKAKRPGTSRGVLLCGVPDNDLLSHGQSGLSSARRRFTVLFGMGRGGTGGLWSSGVEGGKARRVGCRRIRHRCGYGVKPHGPLVPVSSTHYCASTPGLSTWWSATTLLGDQVPGNPHLQARFPLRCFQRLSLPYIATRRCDWRHNRYTSGTSTPVLSY